VPHQDRVRRERARSQGRLPAAADPRHADLARHQLHEAVEDVLLAGDVVVERHRLDLERLGEPAHRERVDAALVGQPERRANHLFPAQWRAACRLPGNLLLHRGLSRASLRTP
jgi:hypothetical protein